MKYVPIIKKVLDTHVGFLSNTPAYVIVFFDYISQTGDFANYDAVFEVIYNICAEDSRLLVGVPSWILDPHDQDISFENFLGIGDIGLPKEQQNIVNYFVEKGIIKSRYVLDSMIDEDDFFPLKSIDHDLLRDYCKLVGSSLVGLYCIIIINKDVVVYVHEDMGFVVVDLGDQNGLIDLILGAVDVSQGKIYELDN